MQIDDKNVYRIPLKYICDLGQINFPAKTDIKICLALEPEMKKLFVTTTGASDAQIVFTKTPYLQYEQILLTKNFRQYLKTILLL